MTSKRRPPKRHQEVVQAQSGQKESASSESLAKEDTASAYSTNTQEGVSTKVKNTNTLPAPADRATDPALAGSRIARIFFDEAEAPHRAPFLWKVEHLLPWSFADKFFETEAEAWEYAAQQVGLERALDLERTPALPTTTVHVSDPGLEHGLTYLEARNIRDDASRWPAAERIVTPGTRAYSVLLAYAGPQEQLEKFSPAMLFQILQNFHPCLVFTTPRPAWATDTDSTSTLNGQPLCIHSVTLAEGHAWYVTMQRLDTLTDDGVTLGPVEVVPGASDEPMDRAALTAFSGALRSAAVQLEVLGK